MRILMVTSHFFPHIGGVERHVLMLSKALSEIRCEVLVYTPTSGPEEVKGVHVLRIRRRMKLDGWLHCLRRLELFRWADVVHVHNPHALLSLAFPARLLLPRKPFVITLHGYASLPPPKLDVALQRLSAWLCQGVFCVGEFVAKWYGLKKCEVIWGATEVPSEVAPFPEEPVLAYVGRLHRDRPAALAILAVAFARQFGPSVKLKPLVAGGGPLESELKALSRRMNIGTNFLGWVSEPREVLRRSSIVVASGYLSALEAMSEGRPVLAVARDRWEMDYWRGFPGPVVLAKCAKEAGEKVALLLSDRERLFELSARSREFAHQMTWEKLAEAHLEVYKKVAGRG